MPESSSARPNVLVIMSDDHAQWAVGAHGNREIVTPNMDWLAASGWAARNAYTPSPVCSPARACFFTGRLPSQHGIHDWLGGGEEPAGGWMGREVNLAQLLKGAGYRTGLVGKWHCGRDTDRAPGFDRWFCYEHGQYPHRGTVRFREIDADGSRPVMHEGLQAPFLTQQARRFLQGRAEPFFLFVGYVNTHSPFKDQPERWVDYYRRRANFSDAPQEPPAHREGWTRFGCPPDAPRGREWLAQYYAAVSHIDEQVGTLIDELDNLGRLDNTLIVYTSDHGHMNGQHGLYTKGNATVPQNFYEESIRVPLVMRWPLRLRSGTVLDGMVDHCDLFQTIAAAAGAPLPAGIAYPGRSFLPGCDGAPPVTKAVQFCEYGNARMAFDGRYKLVHHYAPPDPPYSLEFYDLQTDPRETNNCFAHPGVGAIVRRLENELQKHFDRWEVPGRAGREVLAQPRANASSEPWRQVAPAQPPPEGTDFRAIADY